VQQKIVDVICRLLGGAIVGMAIFYVGAGSGFLMRWKYDWFNSDINSYIFMAVCSAIGCALGVYLIPSKHVKPKLWIILGTTVLAGMLAVMIANSFDSSRTNLIALSTALGTAVLTYYLSLLTRQKPESA
jgi:hypothetical protein